MSPREQIGLILLTATAARTTKDPKQGATKSRTPAFAAFMRHTFLAIRGFFQAIGGCDGTIAPLPLTGPLTRLLIRPDRTRG